MGMIEASTTVIKVQGQTVWLAGGRDNGCGSCGQKSGCSARSLADLFGKKNVLADTLIPLQTGDRVVIEIDENVLLRGAVLLYLLPLLGLFLSVVLADSLLTQTMPYRELCLAGGALLGLFLSFNGVSRHQHGVARPVVVRKLS